MNSIVINLCSKCNNLTPSSCEKKHFKRRGSIGEVEGVESLDDLEFHRLFGAGTFGRGEFFILRSLIFLRPIIILCFVCISNLSLDCQPTRQACSICAEDTKQARVVKSEASRWCAAREVRDGQARSSFCL